MCIRDRYNRLERLEDYLSERDLIHLLVETVAQGGNLHLAISPCEPENFLAQPFVLSI